MQDLQTPFQLPNGTVLQNRIAKSAMSENLSTSSHAPTETLINAYRIWASATPGLLITGNVMIDSQAIGEARNVVVEDERHLPLLKQWASIVDGTGVHMWPQINHPGRQAFGSINKEIYAPSAIPVKVKGASALFRTPKALSEQQILSIIERFGNTAKVLKDAGFTGVQIHGAHGYLVSQFLSPLVNIRTDDWGGSLENRTRFVLAVYDNIRSKVGRDFPVGIKINSADFQRGGFTEEESMEVLRMLDDKGIDLLEISGGSYERPAMMGATQKQSTIEREAYFLEYIKKARKIIGKPLMLTGGFRSVSVMERAVADGHVDIIGLGRPFALYPDLCTQIFEKQLSALETPLPKTGIRAIDESGSLELLWYELQIKRIGQGKQPNPQLNGFKGLGRNIWVSMLKSLFRN